MRSFFVAASLLLAGGALATDHLTAPHAVASAPPAVVSAPPAAASPVAGSEAVHVVDVSNAKGDLTFFPENTKANVGDLVQFQFWPKNHSVVQSAFASPCLPLQQTTQNVTNAFFSGFMPTTRTERSQPALVYTVRVTGTNPMWFYCSQGRHCQSGMVGAINAPEAGDRTIAAYKQLAGAATQNISPGQAPVAGAPVGTPGAPTLPSTLATAVPPTGVDLAGTPTGAPVQQTVNSSPQTLDAARGGFVGVVAAALALLAL